LLDKYRLIKIPYPFLFIFANFQKSLELWFPEQIDLKEHLSDYVQPTNY